MLQLNTHSDKVHKEYLDKLLPGLIKRIKNGRIDHGNRIELTDSVKAILLPDWANPVPLQTDLLKKLLIGNPQVLESTNIYINTQISALPKAERNDNKRIELIFHYDGVFKGNKERSYWLAKIIGRNTCTYCNRQYVFTIESINKAGEINYIARPEFDHWFAKSDFPLLSISLYNLIPSCKTCNSSVKGQTTMDLTTHVHPYIKDNDPSSIFSFKAVPKATNGLKWGLTIERQKGSKIDNTIKDLALEEIYSMHEPLEVKDIMDFYDSYPSDYINSIITQLNHDSIVGITRDDVYRILFGTEADSDKFLDRPFSKLKHDLLKQIGVNLNPQIDQFY